MDTSTLASILHILSDLPAFVGYTFGALLATMIYRHGQLASSPEAHPLLWRVGIAFLGLSAMVRLASGVQSGVKLSLDYELTFLTIIFKIPLGIVAGVFVYLVWRRRYEFIALGLIWKATGKIGAGE